MTIKFLRTLSLAIAMLFTSLALELTAFAGPPLICQRIEIGEAKSLPWAGSQWRDIKRDYDPNRLVSDTLAILTPDAPVIVRMETLRRATIYAMWSRVDREVGYDIKNTKIADELLAKLMERTREKVRNGESAALALFDAGYLAACYQQASHRTVLTTASQMQPYSMVRKASGFGVQRAEMEFALALISIHPQQASHRDHLARAVAGAKEGSLLGKNLLSHFGKPGQKLADLRGQTATARN